MRCAGNLSDYDESLKEGKAIIMVSSDTPETYLRAIASWYESRRKLENLKGRSQEENILISRVRDRKNRLSNEVKENFHYLKRRTPL